MSEQRQLVWLDMMRAKDQNTKRYLKALGGRIAARRKELGITQVQLAKTLGATQKVVTSYETGDCQIPVWRIPVLAEALQIPVEDLLGVKNGQKGKRGREPKLLKQLEEIRQLPRSEQQFVSKLLENVLEKAATAAH